MATKTCYYEVLKVERTATKQQVDRAYRKLAIKYHPDSNRDDESATAKFKEATEAYEVLSDANKRARYDQYGHAGVEGATQQYGDVEDIFDAVPMFAAMSRSHSKRPLADATRTSCSVAAFPATPVTAAVPPRAANRAPAPCAAGKDKSSSQRASFASKRLARPAKVLANKSANRAANAVALERKTKKPR